MKPNATAVSAPIPGMGLTSKLGSRPWQRPPEFTTLEEAVPFYMSSLNSKKFMNAFLDSLEAGIPVTSLVDTMTQAAVLEGKHTIDISVLVAPIMLEALITLAERSGIDYVSGLEDADDDAPMSESAMRAMLRIKTCEPTSWTLSVDATAVWRTP